MTDLLATLGYATVAGLAIPLGGLTACIERIRPRWLEEELRHSVIAFGGGVLLAAVALVLVPEAIRHLPVWYGAAAFAFGGVVFALLDHAIKASGASAAQLMAMLLDFVPEAIALGATLAAGSSAGILLAFLIALQNFPEGFNAYRELVKTAGVAPRVVLGGFAALVPLGPLAAWLGFVYLADAPQVLGALMLVAAGGILYLTFEDIAPEAKPRLERRWAPPLGAVGGFLLGLIGHQLIT